MCGIIIISLPHLNTLISGPVYIYVSSKALNWVFVVDTMNFSFWPETDRHQCEVTYKGTTYTGYMTLCAAITRALDEGATVDYFTLSILWGLHLFFTCWFRFYAKTNPLISSLHSCSWLKKKKKGCWLAYRHQALKDTFLTLLFSKSFAGFFEIKCEIPLLALMSFLWLTGLNSPLAIDEIIALMFPLLCSACCRIPLVIV